MISFQHFIILFLKYYNVHNMQSLKYTYVSLLVFNFFVLLYKQAKS